MGNDEGRRVNGGGVFIAYGGGRAEMRRSRKERLKARG